MQADSEWTDSEVEFAIIRGDEWILIKQKVSFCNLTGQAVVFRQQLGSWMFRAALDGGSAGTYLALEAKIAVRP